MPVNELSTTHLLPLLAGLLCTYVLTLWISDADIRQCEREGAKANADLLGNATPSVMVSGPNGFLVRRDENPAPRWLSGLTRPSSVPIPNSTSLAVYIEEHSFVFQATT